VNTRVLINELSASTRKKITLATIPDSVLDEWASIGFDAVWLMGVWSTGKTGQKIAREYPGVQEEYRNALPDVKTDDIVGSPYAVKGYTVSPALGGNKALLELRKRLEKRGIAVILDFVSNHTGPHHPWLAQSRSLHSRSAWRGNQSARVLLPRLQPQRRSIIAFERSTAESGANDTAQPNHLHPALRGKLLR
jgi:glycosidase